MPVENECGGAIHWNRRALLRMAGLSGLSWLTPLATALARSADHRRKPAQSLILIWLEGAPSQLETFDPHPGTQIAAGSRARSTAANGIQIGIGFEQLADQMDAVSLIRAVTSKEGDHERAIYNIKTGFRPDPTLIHPAIGSVICHQDPRDQVLDIPRHISILPGAFAARGGYLGDDLDAFKIDDPVRPVPDVKSEIESARQRRRLTDLEFLDRGFSRNRRNDTANGQPFGRHNLDAALRMMSSEQLSAFDVNTLPLRERMRYGDTPFGRGCLAALRLVQVGVRCVEVTLPGWDTHVNNHELQAAQIAILDPALGSLIEDLRKQDLLASTLVLCGGEFGRTPRLNPAGGRDHWPHGFSMAIAGGGIQGGRVVGATSPTPHIDAKDHSSDLHNPSTVEDVHATIYSAFGIDPTTELMTPIGRPMKIGEGRPLRQLLDS